MSGEVDFLYRPLYCPKYRPVKFQFVNVELLRLGHELDLECSSPTTSNNDSKG
jgi:hypothetical protein